MVIHSDLNARRPAKSCSLPFIQSNAVTQPFGGITQGSLRSAQMTRRRRQRSSSLPYSARTTGWASVHSYSHGGRTQFQPCARILGAASLTPIRQQFSTAIRIAVSACGIDVLHTLPDIGLHEGGSLYLTTAAGENALRATHTLPCAHQADVARHPRWCDGAVAPLPHAARYPAARRRGTLD